jgi:hypothetical protein
VVDQRAQLGRRSRHLGVQIEAGERGAEPLEDDDEIAGIQIGAKRLLHPAGDAGAGASEPKHDVHVIRCDMRLYRHLEITTAFGELPTVGRKIGLAAPADARVRRQVARVLRRSARAQVLRRGDDQLALPGRDGNPELRRIAIQNYRKDLISASAIADASAFAVSQPASVDINEIVVRPAAQEY